MNGLWYRVKREFWSFTVTSPYLLSLKNRSLWVPGFVGQRPKSQFICPVSASGTFSRGDDPGRAQGLQNIPQMSAYMPESAFSPGLWTKSYIPVIWREVMVLRGQDAHSQKTNCCLCRVDPEKTRVRQEMETSGKKNKLIKKKIKYIYTHLRVPKW